MFIKEKYVRVINGDKSYTSGYIFKLDEINVADVWNPNETDPKLQGGFNYTNETNVLRWLIRGDTICDVIIPDSAEVVCIDNKNTPNGVWRTNKIIITNPRKVTDEMCVQLYYLSHFPQNTYYQILAIMAGKGFYNVCKLILAEKINKENVQDCIKEFLHFDFYKNEGIYNKILTILQKMNSDCK